MVAEIIINSKAKEINRTFDYIIPQNMQDSVNIGSRVYVPFGRQKLQEGFIINIKDDSEYANKEIIKIKDNLLSKEKIELARIMARRYFCNVSDCIKLMLPPGNKTIETKTKEKQAQYVYLKNNIEKLKSEKQTKVIEHLRKEDGILVSDLREKTGVSIDIIKRLERNGYIELITKRVERNPFINKNIKPDVRLDLTEEQKLAYEKIVNNKYQEILLYGITGSRKNRSISASYSKCIR